MSKKILSWHRPSAQPDYDEVTLNSKGEVVDHRMRVFPAAKLFTQDDETDAGEENEPKSFEEVIQDEQNHLIGKIREQQDALNYDGARLFYSQDEIDQALARCLSDVDKPTSDDFAVLDALIGEQAENDDEADEE